MPNRTPLTFIKVAAALALLLQGCSLLSAGKGSGAVGPAQSGGNALIATLSEMQGLVEARQSSQAEFSPAGEGASVGAGGQVRTGDDGRARLNLSSGSIVRIAPSSSFTLSGNEARPEGLLTTIKLEAGKIWVILNGGEIDIETPSGVASVRGSYMSAQLQPDGAVRITCLEGECSLKTAASMTELIAGQGATLLNASAPPQQDSMTQEEFDEWLAVNPEAVVVLPAVTATQGPLPAPQPTGTPVSVGPNQGDFPAGYNPLTGQPAPDPSLLDLPAILLSVSHFPASARPQSGLSFAPMVFEVYITEGATRFLAVFYGDFPPPGGASEIPPQVGPVRSGRLIYSYIGEFFQNSCLIIASASQEVLARLPKCSMAFGNDSGGGSMLDLTRLEQIAEQNGANSGPFNYASNEFSDQPQPGGTPVSEVNVFYSFLNQSGWVYDPMTGSWLRYVDDADKNNPGVLHADTDRLTGLQLEVENLIVLFADHEVVSSTNLDIHLDQGETGDALLFRDGMQFRIRWSTRAGEYERATGLRRPIAFVDEDGIPVQLKPGHSWILVVTPFSTVTETSPGVWKLRFYAPDGAK